ncbi:hypothetical protein FRC11_002900, partial [Ceratobasidium sp. 423]
LPCPRKSLKKSPSAQNPSLSHSQTPNSSKSPLTSPRRTRMSWSPSLLHLFLRSI